MWFHYSQLRTSLLLVFTLVTAQVFLLGAAARVSASSGVLCQNLDAYVPVEDSHWIGSNSTRLPVDASPEFKTAVDAFNDCDSGDLRDALHELKVWRVPSNQTLPIHYLLKDWTKECSSDEAIHRMAEVFLAFLEEKKLRLNVCDVNSLMKAPHQGKGLSPIISSVPDLEEVLPKSQRSLLLEAIQLNDVEWTRALLQAGADPYRKTKTGRSVLHESAWEGYYPHLLVIWNEHRGLVPDDAFLNELRKEEKKLWTELNRAYDPWSGSAPHDLLLRRQNIFESILLFESYGSKKKASSRLTPLASLSKAEEIELCSLVAAVKPGRDSEARILSWLLNKRPRKDLVCNDEEPIIQVAVRTGSVPLISRLSELGFDLMRLDYNGKSIFDEISMKRSSFFSAQYFSFMQILKRQIESRPPPSKRSGMLMQMILIREFYRMSRLSHDPLIREWFIKHLSQVIDWHEEAVQFQQRTYQAASEISQAPLLVQAIADQDEEVLKILLERNFDNWDLTLEQIGLLLLSPGVYRGDQKDQLRECLNTLAQSELCEYWMRWEEGAAFVSRGRLVSGQFVHFLAQIGIAVPGSMTPKLLWRLMEVSQERAKFRQRTWSGGEVRSERIEPEFFEWADGEWEALFQTLHEEEKSKLFFQLMGRYEFEYLNRIVSAVATNKIEWSLHQSSLQWNSSSSRESPLYWGVLLFLSPFDERIKQSEFVQFYSNESRVRFGYQRSKVEALDSGIIPLMTFLYQSGGKDLDRPLLCALKDLKNHHKVLLDATNQVYYRQTRWGPETPGGALIPEGEDPLLSGEQISQVLDAVGMRELVEKTKCPVRWSVR